MVQGGSSRAFVQPTKPAKRGRVANQKNRPPSSWLPHGMLARPHVQLPDQVCTTPRAQDALEREERSRDVVLAHPASHAGSAIPSRRAARFFRHAHSFLRHAIIPNYAASFSHHHCHVSCVPVHATTSTILAIPTPPSWPTGNTTNALRRSYVIATRLDATAPTF